MVRFQNYGSKPRDPDCLKQHISFFSNLIFRCWKKSFEWNTVKTNSSSGDIFFQNKDTFHLSQRMVLVFLKNQEKRL